MYRQTYIRTHIHRHAHTYLLCLQCLFGCFCRLLLFVVRILHSLSVEVYKKIKSNTYVLPKSNLGRRLLVMKPGRIRAFDSIGGKV